MAVKWKHALCLGAGNVATQYTKWRRCVNIESCTTPNSAWNLSNLERRLLKWYDMHTEMRPWVVQGVSSGTRASREAEHHLKMTRGQSNLPCSIPKNVETIRRLVHEDRCRTIKDIAAIVNVSYRTVQTILTRDLNMHCAAAMFMLRLLTPKQKEHHVAICQELRQRAVDDPSFMLRVIKGDESWVYRYDPKTKWRSSQWKSPGSPKPKKVRQNRSATKSKLIVFFDIRGTGHHEFAPEGQTVNAGFYCNVLCYLREDIQWKRPEPWHAGIWLLHDDNAPSHQALETREFLAHNSIITLSHPPYSPDLAPCNFFLFPKMKLQLKGRRFDTVEIQRESQNVLGMLWEQDFQHAFQQWQRYWYWCVAAQGDYFEGMLPKLKPSKYILVYRSSLFLIHPCKLKCNTCNISYVGQTERSIQVRHKEHTRYTKTNNPVSAYALHLLNNRHKYGMLNKPENY